MSLPRVQTIDRTFCVGPVRLRYVEYNSETYKLGVQEIHGRWVLNDSSGYTKCIVVSPC